MSGQDRKEKLTASLSEEWQAEFCRAVVEKIFKAAKTAPEIGPQIGDEMEDGTIYAGVSPDTGTALYATPADAPLTYTFNQAQQYAEKLDAHGHKDWRAPTKGELNVLFQNRAAIGGFDETGSCPAGWYWSSSPSILNGWAQRFSDGNQNITTRHGDSSLRCVRG